MHGLQEGYRTHRQSASISYDLQTHRQQTAYRLGFPHRKFDVSPEHYNTKRTLDLRLFRTCRQVYHEVRSVFYRSHTFVFLGFSTFSAYFGLIALDQVHVPRSTNPHRLRAIQAMTKVEICGNFGTRKSVDFVSASRLIRMALGCFTSLASLELTLNIWKPIDEGRDWTIDDSIFIKPPTLTKLVVDVRIYERRSGGNHASEEDVRDTAEELLHRIMKQKGFTDTTEPFWRNTKSAASTNHRERG